MSTEILHLLLSKCDVICTDDSNLGMAAFGEAVSKAGMVGGGQETPEAQLWA